MASRAPASIPRWLAFHLVHQRERCKSAESRINLLLGTPPRYCGVDGTRDWSRLSKSKRISFRLGADNIRNEFGARKRRLTYPRESTLRTFPQREIERLPPRAFYTGNCFHAFRSSFRVFLNRSRSNASSNEHQARVRPFSGGPASRLNTAKKYSTRKPAPRKRYSSEPAAPTHLPITPASSRASRNAASSAVSPFSM